MPRVARKTSPTGFYHAVTKGDGGRILFESDFDRQKYLELLEQAVSKFPVKTHAFCLMDNHVHLLLEDLSNGLGPFMKQLDESYAMYFAKRTGHCGHVFQGRYWSEPIGNDNYYLCALRYIHANPEAAGMCRQDEYAWSSYQAHAGLEDSFVATELSHDLLGGPGGFVEFSETAPSRCTAFPGSAMKGHLSYDELLQIAQRVIGPDKLSLIKALKPVERAPLIEKMVEAGFNIREISRLTGLGKDSIR